MIQISPTRSALFQAAAEHFVAAAAQAVSARGQFLVALSGGATPRELYAVLATPVFARRVDWTSVHVFWGDERCVPPDDPRSNYRMAAESLLHAVPIPPGNIHRMRAEADPKLAAAEYEDLLRQFFSHASGIEEATIGFDLLLLGLGEDGHTASIFPGTPALFERARWVMPNRLDQSSMWRVTLTSPVINAARQVTFLVAGNDKAQVLQRVLEGPYEPDRLPAQIVRPARGTLTWLIDAEAGKLLKSANSPVDIVDLKRQAAEYAVQWVESGMVVGLGTGTTAVWGIRKIGELLQSGQLRDIVAYPTSLASEAEARRSGIPLVNTSDPPEVDITIDGADEVDPAGNLIKGGGGALLREKIVAQASRRQVIVIDESKLSPRLGTRGALPVEVIPFAWRAQSRYLESLGAKVSARKTAEGADYLTDQGNLILDGAFGPIDDPSPLAERLDRRAGIVEHGLFIGLATDLVVAGRHVIRHVKFAR